MSAKHAVVFPAVLCLMNVGCQKGYDLQLVRWPLPPVPVVVPHLSTGEFIFAVSAKNFSANPSPEAFLRVLVKWDPNLTCGNSVTLQSEKVYPIPPLPPGETWSLISKPVTDVAGQTGCSCKQGLCAGTIYFTLLRDDFPYVGFSGPNTSLQVQWDKEGDLAKLVVKDVSGSIPQ